MKYNPKIVIAYFRSQGLPEPVTEEMFYKGRRWRLDFAWPRCWPRWKVYLECDGGVWSRGAHGRGSGIVRDIEKQNAAVCLGWRPLRCTPQTLCTLETVEMVKKCLELT